MTVDQGRHFSRIDGYSDPLPHDSELYRTLMSAFSRDVGTVSDEFLGYCKDHYKIIDLAVPRSAGTGSLGIQRYCALMKGDRDNNCDDVMLDVEQQEQPTAFSCLSDEAMREYRFNFKNHAHRHSEVYRALPQYPGCHLGWLYVDEVWFLVRERSPHKHDFQQKS